MLLSKGRVCANNVGLRNFSVVTVRYAYNSSIVDLRMRQQNAFQLGRRDLKSAAISRRILIGGRE